MKRLPLLQGEYVAGDVLQIGGSMVIWNVVAVRLCEATRERKRDKAHALCPGDWSKHSGQVMRGESCRI